MAREHRQTEIDQSRRNTPGGAGAGRLNRGGNSGSGSDTVRVIRICLAVAADQGRAEVLSLLSRALICMAATLAVGAHADDVSIQLGQTNSVVPIEAPPGPAFLERFKASFNDGVDEVFSDRLHPFNIMNWSVELSQPSYDNFRERTSSAARNALSKSVVNGLREASVDLPVLVWLNERQGLLADFLRNSIDSVQEEAVSPLDVSYRAEERSWWRRVSESGAVRYGIRPFTTSPYTFLTVALRDSEELFLLAHVRYHYRNFADHLFEIALSLPLPHGVAMDVGTSYQFGRHDAQERLTFKLFKEFKSGGIMHVGVDVQRHPAFFAGIAFPW